jgi:hypothetical protein
MHAAGQNAVSLAMTSSRVRCLAALLDCFPFQGEEDVSRVKLVAHLPGDSYFEALSYARIACSREPGDEAPSLPLVRTSEVEAAKKL